MSSQAGSDRIPIYDTQQVVDNEIEYLRPTRDDRERPQLSALCLSGGGIRSAAFCLGVIQGLCARQLLLKFNYLSTVSGGGFIGGWLLNVLRQEAGDRAKPPPDSAVSQQSAAEPGPEPVRCHDPTFADIQRRISDGTLLQLQQLRNFTNYLTPDTGLFSSDTWAGISLYIRNLFLTWLVILPAFAAIGLFFVSYRTILSLGEVGPSPLLAVTLIGLLSLMLGYAFFNACILLPSHLRRGSEGSLSYASRGRIYRRVIWPCFLWAILSPVPFYLAVVAEKNAKSELPLLLALLPGGFLAASIGGYVAAFLYSRARGHPNRHLFKHNFQLWVLSGVVASLFFLAACHFLYGWLPPDVICPTANAEGDCFQHRESARWTIIVFPSVAMASLLAQNIIFIGWRKDSPLSNLDREWLSQIDGSLLRLTLAWTAVAVATLYLSSLFSTDTLTKLSGFVPTIAAFATGPIAALIGKYTSGSAVGTSLRDSVASFALKLLSLLFIVFIFSFLNFALQYNLGKAQELIARYAPNFNPIVYAQTIFWALILLMYFMTRDLPVNRFSMHGVYRNRLARAFLGTARRQSHHARDPLSGFHENDDVKLCAFDETKAADTNWRGRKLLPLINLTLNLSMAPQAAWQERKAASFPVTPLFCGSAALKPRAELLRAETAPSRLRSDAPRRDREGAFVESAHFGGREIGSASGDDAGLGGATLGAMLTVSGAAVSPNWGYNSSPTVAFLMTLFNVRLGAWYANPARTDDRATLESSSPRNATKALLYELIGITSDKSDFVYLSDGGHFDNLGLYEIFRRKVTSIVVIDAGQDPDCALFDLGSSIRKAQIDGLAEVRFRPIAVMSRADIATSVSLEPLGYAVATVAYPCGARGKLLYLKPSLLRGVPVPVKAYSAVSKLFPHEAAEQQWFSESQFESYRALGEHQIGQLAPAQRPMDIDELMEAAFEAAGGSEHR